MMWDLGLDDLRLFARVAALGSLSAVARERDCPVSQVSRALARIEKSSQARLVHRSTHGLALTAEGQTFARYCVRLVGTMDELEGEFAHQSQDTRGLVRVAISSVIADHLLLPGLPELHRRHPHLALDLRVNDRLVDMAHDGIDIAIRSGEPATDTMVARRIGTLERGLYATPAYLQTHGTPAHPDDLCRHQLIGNSGSPHLNRWSFRITGRIVVFTAEGHWRADTSSVLANLALQGLGIARLTTLVAKPFVRHGELVPVLDEFGAEEPVPVYAVTLSGRHRLPKITACIDYWAEQFGDEALERWPPEGGAVILGAARRMS